VLPKLECHAATADVCRIIGYTLDSNEKALSLARKVGLAISQGVRGVIRLEKALTPRDNGGAQTVNRARAGELW
jgi:hypothetical protein